MPKKSTTARGGAQRNKPKVQKSFELVRETQGQSVDEQVTEEENTSDAEEASAAAVAVSTMEAPEPRKMVRGSTKLAAQEKKSESSAETKVLPETPPTESVSTAPKGSAAAKLAARRQAAQKSQQRAASTLITAEHYTYVRKDLRFILILAIIMFAIIITLHFVPGIGS